MKRVMLAIGFVAAFAAGAFAVYMTQGRVVSTPAVASDAPQEEMVMEIAVVEDINGEITEGTVRVSFEEADGLPEMSPDRMGLYVSHDGDMLQLGTGNIEVEVGIEIENDVEAVAVSAVHSGPEVAVRVTDDTTIYLDTTPSPEPSSADLEAGEMIQKRTVEPGTLSDLAPNMLIRAWGVMDGDVLVADVLVLEPIR